MQMTAPARPIEWERSSSWIASLLGWWRKRRLQRLAKNFQLRPLEAQFAALLVKADIGLAITDGQGKFLITNAAMDGFLGYEAGRLIGTPVSAIQSPEDAALDELLFQEVKAGKRDFYRTDKRYIRIDGSTVWGRLTVSAVRSADGQTLHGIAMVEDITEQRVIKERLDASLKAASEANLRLKIYLQRAPLACIVWDRKQIVREWNPAAEQMFGYSAQEAIGHNVYDLTATPEAMLVVERVRNEFFAGREHPDGIVIDNRRRDGTRFTCHWHFTIVDAATDGVEAVIAFGIDVTSRLRGEQERRILEANLRHAQKMQSLGTLAGGIAHDFNNILLAISGNARLAVQELSQEHPAQVSLHEVTRAVHRASSIVNQILLFSRREDEPTHGPVQLHLLIEEALSLLRASVPANIAFKTDLDGEAPLAQGDAAQLHQVLLNLAANAAYAMNRRGGTLSVELRRFVVDQTDARAVPGLQAGEYARIAVRDTGAGMSTAVMERIFEPFFTTKPHGQGTGLGLSVVHGIVAAHRGVITVCSNEGQGSAFHVYLPAMHQPAVSIKSSPAKSSSTIAERGGGQHVLYLDDEEPLVYLVKRVLERLGYRVSGFTEPSEALRAFTAEPSAFDAIVTDLSMPGLSGTDFAKQILQLRAEVPVIMTSGYVRVQDREAALKVGVRELVLKPNTVEELGGVLHKLLAG
jgi:PAS domain S-box-containing protein